MSNRYKGGVLSATPPTTSSSAAPGIWTLEQQMQATAGTGWPFGGPFTYIEDVFSTWLYTGNGSTQTITNGIDLSTEGGLVWLKNRDGVPANQNHNLVDTLRGINKPIYTNSAGAQLTQNTIASFDTTGFTLGGFGPNGGGATYASWTFRKQPKFFTQGTYSGNGSTQAITHDLGSAPGCVIVKNITTSGSWIVWHRGLSSGYYIQLNGTGAQDNLNATRRFGNNSATVDPTSTTITVGDLINTSGDTWVYYAFAHDAGGFGLTGNDNVISCGTFTSDASGNATVNLGYEPQWLMTKSTNTTGNWVMVDVMRGWAQGNNQNILKANLSDAEAANSANLTNITATGIQSFSTYLGANNTYIYIAIRRGPMKVPTTGTSVFAPVARAGTSSVAVVDAGFPPDLFINLNRDHLYFANNPWFDRLRGLVYSNSNSTAAESDGSPFLTAYGQTGVTLTNSGLNSNATTYITYSMRRAPGYFDEVCYTGTGTAGRTVTHNLQAVPEMMIVKSRSNAANWRVYQAANGNTKSNRLNSDEAAGTNPYAWNNTSPTSTVFTVGDEAAVNASGYTYVAYLFATCAGVSKVGSYTGTATTQQINCGFTGGARFVLIKRTDSTGDWYVYDSARGIVAGNDPYLLLNSTAAEVTGTDYVDTYNAGFELSSTAPAGLNANGGTYIFLAIA